MSNPFRILVIVAVIIAIALAAGFVYVVFAKNPGHVSRSSAEFSLVHLA